MNAQMYSQIDKRTFNSFCKLVYEKCGIKLGEKKEALVAARVAKRMRALDIDSHKKYLNFLNADETGDELIRFLDVISTNVTSFYREPEHFNIMERIIKQWLKNGRSKFRIWCAAASSGEEPYTIAMTMLESTKNYNCDIKILATDISTKILGMAKEGIYKNEKTKGIPANLRTAYFSTTQNTGNVNSYTVKPSLKKVISFARLNLSVTPFPMKGPFDMIFVRNVMIYFDNTVRSRLLEDVYRLLGNGGFLFVGHAESLTGSLHNGLKKYSNSVYVKG